MHDPKDPYNISTAIIKCSGPKGKPVVKAVIKCPMTPAIPANTGDKNTTLNNAGAESSAAVVINVGILMTAHLLHKLPLP